MQSITCVVVNALGHDHRKRQPWHWSVFADHIAAVSSQKAKENMGVSKIKRNRNKSHGQSRQTLTPRAMRNAKSLRGAPQETTVSRLPAGSLGSGRDRWNLPPRLASRAAGVTVTTTIAAAAVAAAVTTAAATAVATAAVATAAAAAVARATAETTTTGAATEAAAATNLTEIAVGSATTATATRAATTATTKRRLASNRLEERGNLLVGLLEEVHELTDDTAVATVEESSGNTSVTSTTGTTNAVNVVIDISGEIVVDDVGDVGNIETTSSDSGSNHKRAATVAEELKSALTLTLGAITVDRGGREVLVDKEVGQRVSHALGLDEDEGEASCGALKDIQKHRALVNILDVLDALGNVLRGGANTTDRKEDVVLKEISGEHLDVAGEGGGEHQSLAVVDQRHVLALNNTANLGLETHVKHAISLVKNKVLDVAEGDATTLEEIDKTTGGGNKEIAATLNLAKLRANIGTTVDNARADPRAVGELAGLVVNLRDKLSGGGKNERGGVSLALTTKLASSVGRDGRGSVDEGLGEDREKETASLARTSLGTSHQITATHDNRDGVLLNRRGDLVASELDVLAQMLIQGRSGKLENRLRDIVTGSLDRDVIVLLEVDTGVLLGGIIDGTEQLPLNARVGRAGDVLAVTPLAVARAARAVAASVAALMAAATTVVATAAAAPAAATVVLMTAVVPVTATTVATLVAV